MRLAPLAFGTLLVPLAAQSFVATSTTRGTGCHGLSLTASNAPAFGTVVGYQIHGAAAPAAIGAVVVGLAALPSGLELSALGMPGCYQYLDLTVAAVNLVFGAPLPVYWLTVPAIPALAGQQLEVQAAALGGTYAGETATSDCVSARVGFAASSIPAAANNLQVIVPGAFLQGQNAIGLPSHQEHPVTLTYPFWIGKDEVTQGEWVARMGSNPSYFQSGSWQQRPVEQVGWHDARAYCQALTQFEQAAGRIPPGYEYRLPTEAEWEYCCRAGTTTEWNTGTTLSMLQANFNWQVGQTTPVGSYPANQWGLFDTHGNVREWCLDSYADYVAGPSVDPFVTGGSDRVNRGGSWFFLSSVCRSAFRSYSPPDFVNFISGLRVVLAPALVP